MSNAQSFMDCLADAEQLLKRYPQLTLKDANDSPAYRVPERFNIALFEKWSEFYEPDFAHQPVVRVLQHLSCTGGTLISKCIASLPNVTLLSEVNPMSALHVESNPPGFAPTDMIYLATRGNLPLINELKESIFRADIRVIARHVSSYGKYLVVREHSHSNYLVDPTPATKGTIRGILKEELPVLPVATVRHPIDSYLSMVKNGWIQFSPGNFNEYCRRYNLFIKDNEHVPMYRYEDFVDKPGPEMQRICESLDLPFHEAFLKIFDINPMSGNSGRSSNVIQKRTRRPFEDDFQKELEESAEYPVLCEKLGYDKAID